MKKLITMAIAIGAFAVALSPAAAAYQFAITQGDTVTRFTIDDLADGGLTTSAGSSYTDDTLNFSVSATVEDPNQITAQPGLSVSFGDLDATNYFTFNKLAYGAFDSFLVGTADQRAGFTLGTFQLLGTDDEVSLTISSDSVAEVPEPASWALMIGGFGMIGATLRRKTIAVTFA